MLGSKFPFRWVMPLLFGLAWSRDTSAARIACVGDSITFGYGLAHPDSESYPAVLGGLLGTTGYAVANFGVSGATLLSHGDKPYTAEATFTASGDFAPDVVVIMLGTNDAKPQNWSHQSEFAPDYRALIDHYRSLGALVYVAAPPPVYAPGAYDISPDVLNGEIVPLVRQIAADAGAPLIDVYAALSNHASEFPDTVHPNADGAKLIAEAVDAALMAHGFGGASASGGMGGGGASAGGGASGAAGGPAGGAGGMAAAGRGGGAAAGSGGAAAGARAAGGADTTGGGAQSGGGTASGAGPNGSGGTLPAGDSGRGGTATHGVAGMPSQAGATGGAGAFAGSGPPTDSGDTGRAGAEGARDSASCGCRVGARHERRLPVALVLAWLGATMTRRRQARRRGRERQTARRTTAS